MSQRSKHESRRDTQHAVRAILAAAVARRAGEPGRAEPRGDDDKRDGDDATIEIDDGEEIGRRDRR